MLRLEPRREPASFIFHLVFDPRRRRRRRSRCNPSARASSSSCDSASASEVVPTSLVSVSGSHAYLADRDRDPKEPKDRSEGVRPSVSLARAALSLSHAEKRATRPPSPARPSVAARRTTRSPPTELGRIRGNRSRVEPVEDVAEGAAKIASERPASSTVPRKKSRLPLFRSCRTTLTAGSA